MQALLSFATLLLRCVLAFFRSRSEQAIVELALRQQLAAYAQARPRPRLRSPDRAFWVAPHRFWPRWRELLLLVQPETVIRWHRKGFRLYWRDLSGAVPDGRASRRKCESSSIVSRSRMLPPSRPRLDLLRGGHGCDQELWHRSRAHCVPQSLAEPHRRTVGRDLPARASRSRNYLQ